MWQGMQPRGDVVRTSTAGTDGRDGVVRCRGTLGRHGWYSNVGTWHGRVWASTAAGQIDSMASAAALVGVMMTNCVRAVVSYTCGNAASIAPWTVRTYDARWTQRCAFVDGRGGLSHGMVWQTRRYLACTCSVVVRTVRVGWGVSCRTVHGVSYAPNGCMQVVAVCPLNGAGTEAVTSKD